MFKSIRKAAVSFGATKTGEEDAEAKKKVQELTGVCCVPAVARA